MAISRSAERLPAEVFRKIEADHILEAVYLLLGGFSKHAFSASIDYDLITDNGERLPPKAVFGLAATLALGFEVLPKHFTAGTNSVCFRTLQKSGYRIVPKGEEAELASALSAIDQDWTEGKAKLVTHLTRERAKGAAQAKRSQFKRDHGRLFCERCNLDPVVEYGSPDGEACIEIHHNTVQISAMDLGHKTVLADLQCLCANCHRFVHNQMKTADVHTEGICTLEAHERELVSTSKLR